MLIFPVWENNKTLLIHAASLNAWNTDVTGHLKTSLEFLHFNRCLYGHRAQKTNNRRILLSHVQWERCTCYRQVSVETVDSFLCVLTALNLTRWENGWFSLSVLSCGSFSHSMSSFTSLPSLFCNRVWYVLSSCSHRQCNSVSVEMFSECVEFDDFHIQRCVCVFWANIKPQSTVRLSVCNGVIAVLFYFICACVFTITLAGSRCVFISWNLFSSWLQNMVFSWIYLF